MYTTLLTKIAATLATVTRVKTVAMYPKTNIAAFPSVTVNPAGVENTFDSVAENMKVYRFDLHVEVGISAAMTQEIAFTTTVPNVIDDIIAAFDAAWDAGTSDAGHRIWQKIDIAEPWQVISDKDGLAVYAPLTLEIKVLTNV